MSIAAGGLVFGNLGVSEEGGGGDGGDGGGDGGGGFWVRSRVLGFGGKSKQCNKGGGLVTELEGFGNLGM